MACFKRNYLDQTLPAWPLIRVYIINKFENFDHVFSWYLHFSVHFHKHVGVIHVLQFMIKWLKNHYVHENQPLNIAIKNSYFLFPSTAAQITLDDSSGNNNMLQFLPSIDFCKYWL